MSKISESPDGSGVALDVAPSTPASKRGSILAGDELAVRDAERAGAQSLDAMVEELPGLNRLQRNRERAFPRDSTAPPPHPRMARHLPSPEEQRVPLSSRQKKARSKIRREAAQKSRVTERIAAHDLITQDKTWTAINGELATAVGDAQQLGPDSFRHVQRVDRFIAQYERLNDRSHVVYANVDFNRGINSSNIEQFLTNQVNPGTQLHCDQYTGAAHTLHEVTDENRNYDATPVLEIETRRGAYVGNSDSLDNTGHLLPRGMSLAVVGHHWAEFVRPDGNTGRRLVVQAKDTTIADD